MIKMNNKPKILILGAGYGGIVTAINLQKKLNNNEADITLVNKHDYHYFTTHLHMPAAGTNSIRKTRVNISEVINENKIKLIKGNISKIVPGEKKVIVDDYEILYDYLVIALGSEPETFNITGLKEHALSIRTINSVRLIKEHIQYQFAKYKSTPQKTELLTFVVGGAGFTGIEFLGELIERIPRLCKQFDVDPNLVKVYNVEAGNTALAGFDPDLVKEVVTKLESKGVIFKFSTAIKECTTDSIILSTEEIIKTSTIIWTGGVRGNHLIEESGIETMRGRVKVEPTLLVSNYEEVFVIGDGALIINSEGRPYPPTAQIAIQEAIVCSDNLIASVRNKELISFTPKISGAVVSFGKYEAVGVVGKRKFKGLKASMLKRLIDIKYLYTIGGLRLVITKGFF
jgi:NADH dehydrogenase